MSRRLLLALLAAIAVFLVPWTVYVGVTLPERFDTGQWRFAWVGFDVVLLLCFAAAVVLGIRRSRATVPLLAATATLLFCDAWFDAALDWGGPDQWASLGTALAAEVPIAVFLLLRARSLLSGDARQRSLTMGDIAVHTNPAYQRLLGRMPATTAELRTQDPSADDALRSLAHAGYAHRARDGRWHSVPQHLRETNPDQFPAADRSAVTAYLDAKYDRELRLFAWAAQRRTTFGEWAAGSRAGMHLTAKDLAEFDAQYLELVHRYASRNPEPTSQTRELALRFYAFPAPEKLP
ncbi:hypothetical protein [Amycolatopsis jejuensis]|uniref:hypothetical protein n=1 Tax=Amycolatopsis jejuensis TaxID=330084 RepID=UPI000A98059C|nr:hypothetical protein [Amycolatopsis jejuensis]